MAHQEQTPVDIDRLADYIGGALDGADHDEVTRLVADDPQWRETYELLVPGMSEVSAGLGEWGAAAEPMPDDVAARLDDAFSTTTSVPVRHLSVVPEVESERPSRSRRRFRWAAPIGVAAAVLAFAGFGVNSLTGGSTDSASEDAASSQAGGAAPNMPAPMMDRQSGAPFPILRSGIDYTAASLAEPPPAIAASRADAAERTFSGEDTQAVPKGVDPALEACLADIAEEHGAGPVTVESVDYALYLGQESLIVRFTAANVFWAYAVGPECGTPERGADVRNQVQVG